MTLSDLIAVFNQAVPHLRFGVRVPGTTRFVPPTTLWARLKQVFTGPRFESRIGEVEVAVVGDVTERDWAVLHDTVHHHVPIGVQITFISYEG
jgi:hypothetical protein